MATTISVALQKGGVGKTTTALSLASTLGFKKKKTLLIDMDSQHNATYASGVDILDDTRTVTDVLGADCTAEEAAISCKYYDLLAGDQYLRNVEAADVSPDLLRKALEPVQSKYDFIIIDTPPAFGNLSTMSLTASNYVLIPAEASIFSLQGVPLLMQTIDTIKERSNPNLQILGILLVRYSNRTNLNKDVKEMLEEYSSKNGITIFENTIREAVAVKEAQITRIPLIDYAKNSKPNIDYKAVTTEILRKLGEL